MKAITILQTLALFPIILASTSQASLYGPEFEKQNNRGSFVCADRKGELEGQFTFGAQQANVTIKGQPVALDCVPARNANPEHAAVFAGQYFRAVEICVGQNAKGNVIVATSNSMGNVQMNAALVGPRGERLAAATLNCQSKPVNTGSNW